MSLNKKAFLQVSGIHCGGCANKIKKSIDELGVDHETEVDVSNGTVKVQFDGTKTTLADVKAKITAVGFQIESVSLE